MRGVSRLLFAIAVFGGCSGTDLTLPTAPSVGAEKRVDSNLLAPVSGFVTDALDGHLLAGITVELPEIGSTVTGADGAFTLDAAGLGSLFLVLRADGYHTRETHVLLTGQPAQIDILPMGREFDLDFFDHVFRNLGADGTERWMQEPRFEIYTGVYEWVEGEFYGDFVAMDEPAPERFVPAASEVIVADSPKYTGGVIGATNIVVVGPHPPGTRLTYREYFKPFTITVLLRDDNESSSELSWTYESGAFYASTIAMGRRFLRDEREVMSHELAHAFGFHHPAGYENVPLPSIMRHAENVTSHDMVHGRILYRRPPGSRTADKDPEGFNINALRAELDSGPPDPSRIRWVRN